MIVAHGGVPLSDRFQRLKERKDFEDLECLQDFVWTRAHERARTKRPSRETKSSEFGYEDFESFCKIAATALDRKVERLVRGHDHVEERYKFYEKYARNSVLTLNTLSHRLPGEFFGPYVRTPCVARWREGKLPEVHRLRIPDHIVKEIYPEVAGGTEQP